MASVKLRHHDTACRCTPIHYGKHTRQRSWRAGVSGSARRRIGLQVKMAKSFREDVINGLEQLLGLVSDDSPIGEARVGDVVAQIDTCDHLYDAVVATVVYGLGLFESFVCVYRGTTGPNDERKSTYSHSQMR